jgi:cytochrome c oxidase subunit 4
MNGESGTAVAGQGGHASVWTYVVVGVVLTIITAVEVAIFYIPALHPIMVPALLMFSAAKFLIVVSFYMHLKYDSAIFRRVFYGPLTLAILVVIGLLILFKFVPGLDPVR